MSLRFAVTPILLLLVCLGSCQNPLTTPSPGQIRASMESSNENAPRLKVWVEGSSGLFLTGALVRAVAPTGETTVLSYSPSVGCFDASLPGVGDGRYQIEANSLAWDQARSITLEHKVMRTKPTLLTLSDGVGDALLGATLAANLDLTLGWSPGLAATSSFVQVSQGGVTRWSATVAGSLVTMPAGTLAVGSYLAQVTSQYLDGDPQFQTKPYFSTSHAQSVVVQFRLQ